MIIVEPITVAPQRRGAHRMESPPPVDAAGGCEGARGGQQGHTVPGLM